MQIEDHGLKQSTISVLAMQVALDFHIFLPKQYLLSQGTAAR